MSQSKTKINSRLEALKANYAESLPGKMQEIEDIWHSINGESWSLEMARELHQHCHRLAGTGKTFGFAKLTPTARAVEQELNKIFDEEVEPDAARLQLLHEKVDVLLIEGPIPDVEVCQTIDPAESKGEDVAADRPRIASDRMAALAQLKPLSQLPIYIVDDDRELADHIASELAMVDYTTRVYYDFSDFEKAIELGDQPPGAIIMDVSFPDAQVGGIESIHHIRAQQILQAPVIFMSASDSFTTRLQAVKAGGDAFLSKPLDIDFLLEKLEVLVGGGQSDALRALILDDDKQFSLRVAAILAGAGIEALAAHDPTDIINLIVEFRPDILLIDMYMPRIGGVDVAKVVRQHESSSSLPMLFLSAESDPNKQFEARNLGVDDFLVKPIDDDHLIWAVANRAQRARTLKALIYRDSLTHLLVHNEMKSQLADQLSIARRNSRALSYAIMDLDFFKVVNDKYGHLVGDAVLKSFAGLLRRSFRRSDVIGRYGGEEFVVIMPDTDVDSALVVLGRTLEEFGRIKHCADGEEFTVTFSAGISGFPLHQEAMKIMIAADDAMYRAKAAGRNQIVVESGEASQMAAM